MRSERMEFAKYDIPQYLEKPNKQKGYISYGDDNMYAQYLISLLAKSSVHAAIVKDKATMVGGQGWIKDNLGVDTMMFLKNARNPMDLDEIMYRCGYDMEIYGSFALNIIWDKARETISEINYIDCSKIRIQTPDPDAKYDKSTTENYFISDGWENERKYPPVLYPGFSTVNRKKASQIYYVKAHRAGTEYYGQPEYLPAVNWIELEWQISQYHLSGVVNGFHPGFLVNWPIGQASDEEMNQLVARLKNQFAGASQTNEPIFTFPERKEDAPEFIPLEENTSDKRFIQLNDMVKEGIYHAHRVTNPELFGINVSGKGGLQIGDKNSMMESLEIFQNKYVTPNQRILEKVFNRLAQINAINDRLYIQKYSEQFRKIDTNIPDVLSILEAAIEPIQKYWILVQNGYTHEIASKLTQYKEGNMIDPTPEKVTTPVVDKTKPTINAN
jgi:hypothetical protein